MGTLNAQDRLSIENGKHLQVSEHTVDVAHPLHWHSFFEIEIVLSGAGKYVINDVSYNIENKNLFFLTSTDFHYLKLDKTTRVINISFDETMVDERNLGELLYAQNDRAYQFDREEYERIVKASELLRHECEIEGECRKNLLQYILRCIFRKNQSRADDLISNVQYRCIRNSITYMEIHFKERITLQKLATEAGYHPTYFSELFKKITGENYIDTLNKLRVGYAKMLLTNDFSVSNACFMSGFGSLSNFLATFKKHCQMSPLEYRMKTRNTAQTTVAVRDG